MNKMCIFFRGWINVDANDITFDYIGTENGESITGVQWLSLTVKQRGNYILTDLVDAQKKAVGGSYTDIDIEEYSE
jgi:hypothetical protein